MGRAASRFRETDVTRAIRAARKAGVDTVRIEIDRDGRMVIITGPAATQQAVNSFD